MARGFFGNVYSNYQIESSALLQCFVSSHVIFLGFVVLGASLPFTMFAILCQPFVIYCVFNQNAITFSHQAIDDRDSNGLSASWQCSICAFCFLVLFFCRIHSVSSCRYLCVLDLSHVWFVLLIPLVQKKNSFFFLLSFFLSRPESCLKIKIFVGKSDVLG